MSASTLTIILNSLGVTLGMFLVGWYRVRKAARTEIPLDWNPKTGVYEPDLRRRRWERRAKAGLIAAIAFVFVAGYALFFSYSSSVPAR